MTVDLGDAVDVMDGTVTDNLVDEIEVIVEGVVVMIVISSVECTNDDEILLTADVDNIVGLLALVVD